ncbi:M20/M25/M40 family metallo-hydrolase [Pseudomonas xantholysinigenes]|uniref:M20/M25/M40 family metallo-hydrolase n=1 Tax=Pseudomonas xantholysinigenes TaxID=2745490 RepID=A0A9E6TVI3_9PSED|nr:M20/M25/M40 family metallo-hydrolase [Pseudomonas xantholysinigenes]QXI36459.1 M20/M25/M40 family metallo-hydrolase [Pseudomonas xantholysinigenes]
MRLLLSTLTLALACSIAHAADTSPQDLFKQAQAEQPRYLETLRTLVSVDTGTGTEAGLVQIGAELEKRLKALGADVRTHPATPSVGNNIVGTFKGTGSKDFLLMVHYDTVFGPGTVARRPFRLEGERAYGPGVADAKGGVAMILHALTLLHDQQFKGYRTLTVLFNPDEEMGSAGSKALIAELARQHDFVFSYEPPDQDAVTVATNGINRLKLEVRGRAAHAGSAPEQGRNALTELAHQLLQLDALGDKAKGTTVNWTLAKAGDKANIIPALATAEADMRYSDLGETARVEADARRIIAQHRVADTQVSLVLEKGRPPLARNTASTRLAATAQQLYREIDRKLEAIAMRFGTDAGFAYVPDSDKPAVLETLGVVGAGLHGDDEYIEVASVAPRLYLTVALIRTLASQ